MKKILTILAISLFATQVYAQVTPNDTATRLAVATQETQIACQIRDDMSLLAKLAVRRNDFFTPFSDNDFVGGTISYVNAYNANGLFDFVNADLQTALAANSGRDQQILEQMCGD